MRVARISFHEKYMYIYSDIKIYSDFLHSVLQKKSMIYMQTVW